MVTEAPPTPELISNRTILYVGAVYPYDPKDEGLAGMDRETYDRYTEAYVACVRHIADNENAYVLAASTSHTFGNKAKLATWDQLHPFYGARTFTASTTKPLLFPQDCFVAGDSGLIIVHPHERALLDPIKHKSKNIRAYTILSEGGRYALGDDIVFAGLGKLNNKEEKLVTDELFPNHSVVFLKTPRELEMFGGMRVVSHIDEHIGGPMKLDDGRLLVPIHMEYYEALQNELPTETHDGRDIAYLPIDGIEPSTHYLFNYPRTPGGTFYIGPLLANILDSKGWLKRIASSYSILPEEVSVYVGTKAGLKCRINII